MGCLLQKLTGNSKNVNAKNYMLKENKKVTRIQPETINDKDQSYPNNLNQQKLPQDNFSYLLTDSSEDDQDIDLFDQQFRVRRKQLMQKKRTLNFFPKYKSQNDLDKCSKNEIKIRRSCSFGQISKINISINNLYYEKFLKLRAIQKKHKLEQIDSVLIEIEEQNKIFLENNEEEEIESSFSSMEQLVSQCYNCKKVIGDDQYQLECQHIFDTECIKDQTQIYCVCQQIINTKSLKQILITNVEQCEQYLERLFANQCQNLKLIIQ